MTLRALKTIINPKEKLKKTALSSMLLDPLAFTTLEDEP